MNLKDFTEINIYLSSVESSSLNKSYLALKLYTELYNTLNNYNSYIIC